MKWIKVEDQLPPIDRKILVCDTIGWVFVGLHETNYEDHEDNENFYEKYLKNINPFIFHCITVNYCSSEAVFWMELPPTPQEDSSIWNDRKLKDHESDEEILAYHKTLGIIVSYNFWYSDTYDCKVNWKDEDITYWMPLPLPPSEEGE